MKKIISLFVFVLLLAWTWNLIHSEPTVSFETHSIIQQKLGDIIKNSVLKHRPTAQDFALLRLWTETLNADRVRAHFTYKFKEGTGAEASEETVGGDALLQKITGTDTAQENWRVEKVQTSSNQVVFQEGTLIDFKGEAETPVAPESPTTEN